MNALKRQLKRFWGWLTHPERHQVRVPTVAAATDALLMLAVVIFAMEGHLILGSFLFVWASIKILMPLFVANPERVRLGIAN